MTEQEELIYIGNKINCMPTGTLCRVVKDFGDKVLVEDNFNQTWLVSKKEVQSKYEKPKRKILWRK